MSCESSISEAAAARVRWDVVVIGAGLSGSVTAHMTARRGRAVLLVDRSVMPRAKVCGCCMAPGGVRMLHENGLGSALRGAGIVERCTIRVGRGVATVPAPGYRVIGRDVLDARLALMAHGSGAELLLGWSARVGSDGSVRLRRVGAASVQPPGDDATEPAGTELVVHPRAIVVADGLAGSSLADRPEFAWRVSARSRMGVGATLTPPRSPLPEGEIVMCCGRDGYVGLVRLPTGEIDIAAAILPQAARDAGGPAALCSRIVAGCGAEPGELRGAVWRGTPLLTRSRRCVEAGNVLVLGDAAGYVEPFTGEGMTWAIEGAILAAGVIDDRLADRVTAGAWTWSLHTMIAGKHRRCRIASALLRHEGLMRLAVAVGERWPRAGRWACGFLGSPSEVNGRRLA